jgi:hypothetical protein
MNRRLASKSKRRAYSIIPVIVIIFSILACNLTGQSEDDNAGELAATITAMQATLVAQAAAPTIAPPTAVPPTSLPPTQPPPTAPPANPTPALPTQAAVVSTPGQPQSSAFNLNEIMGEADILVYEDVAGNPDLRPYVKMAMERLGFQRDDYVYLGDARGRLMEGLKIGAQSGEAWDLVVIAAEDRSGVQGEFFEMLEGVLAKGTPVILEAWHLDEIREGAIKPILMRCGVDLVNWYGGARDPGALKVYPLIPDSPLLNEALQVGAFRIADYWPYEEQGSLTYSVGTGDAKIVVGTRMDEPNSYGVLTECLDGQLILITYSSHNYLDETAVPLWMNYIHYALRKHFE